MAARKGGLGKGLDTLIPPKKNETTKEVEKVEIKKIEEYVDINKVEPNKDQPRKSINEDSLSYQSLLSSMESFSHWLLQRKMIILKSLPVKEDGVQQRKLV